jgi:hypothetical protein
MKQKAANESQEKREQDLQWKKSVIEFFMSIDPINKQPISNETVHESATTLLQNMPTDGKTDTTRMFMKTLKMVLTREGLDNEAWEYVRSYFTKVLCKRSGCFTEVKRSAYTAENPSDIFNEGVKKVAATLNMSKKEVHVQNSALFDIAKDKADSTARYRMKGDGESNRMAWSTKHTKRPNSRPTKQTNVVVVADVADVDTVADVADVDTEDTALKEMMIGMSMSPFRRAYNELIQLDSTKKDDALALAEMLPIISASKIIKDTKLPIGPLTSLIISTGCTNDNMRDTLAAVMQELLSGWQDPEEAAEKAARVFAECVRPTKTITEE